MSHADDDSLAPGVASHTRTEVIEEVLARPTLPIEFGETALKDIVDYLKGAAKIEILLDESGLKDAKVEPDTLVSCNLRGIALADAIDIVLDRLGLVWTIHNDVLWITSPDKAGSYGFLETRVYDVADLVVYQDEKGVKFDDYSPLMDTITKTIDTKSWLDNSGSGTMHGESLGSAKVLVVSQSYRVQKKIALLLARIREVAAEKQGDAVPHRERPKEPPFHRGNAGSSAGSEGPSRPREAQRESPAPAKKPDAAKPAGGDDPFAP